MKYGIQLYSVKNHMMEDVKGTLRQIAEMGYQMVEPAGFFDTPAEDFKAWCDEFGLEVCGSHSGFMKLEENTQGVIDYHKTIGCPSYIIPNAPIKTKEALEATIAKVNKFAPIIEAAGMTFGFHNHDGEFLPNEDGIIPHLELQKRTNAKFEIDVYWTYRAGLNPIYILESLKDRISWIHLKDGTMEHGTPLGQGTAPIAEVVAWAKKNNVPMVVENEPKAEVEMTEAKMCIDYLKSLEA